MARAKARGLGHSGIYIYSYGASWLIFQLAAHWVRLICDEVSVV